MSEQFVTIDDGEEVDWIDHVESTGETATAWFVDNGHHVHEVPKLPGRTVELRDMGDDDA